MKRVLMWLRVVAAVALLAVVVALAGPQRVLDSVRDAHPGWLALGLMASVGANVMSALRWRELSRWLGLHVRRAWAVVTYFHGVAVNALLPGAVVGGDMLRAYALQRLGHPGLESGMTVLLDRMSGLWMLCVVGFLAIAWGADSASALALATRWPALGRWPLAPSALAIVAIALIVPWVGLMTIARWLPEHDSPRLERLRAALRRGHAGRHYLAQIGMSTIVQLLAVASLACAAQALHASLPLWAIAACAVPIFVMATLPVSFGGWGTREAAAVVAFGAFGVSAPAAVTISMIYGVYSLVQAVGGLAKVPQAVAAPAARPME